MQKQKRLSTLGLLDFNRCASEVDLFARPLDFDRNPNPMGLPKLMIQGDFIAVGQIEVLDEWSQSPSGTITAIEQKLLKVSSQSYEIALHQIQTLEGQPLSIADLSKKYGLQIGYQFKEIKPEIAQEIETFNHLIAKHEAFWIERLVSLQPITIPYADQTASQLKQKRFSSARIPVPDEVISFVERNSDWNLGDFLTAAFVGYLARIGGTNSFDLGFRDSELVRELKISASFFAAYVPCHLEINLEQSFEEFFAAIRSQVELTKQHKTYARDIVVRHPLLRSIPELVPSEIFPVAIARVEKIAQQPSELGNELTLIIPTDERECVWLYNAAAFGDRSIGKMLKQFTIFLQGIAQDSTQPLAHLSLLTDWERNKILVEWNDTAVEYPKDKCIHQLFETQVEKTPDAVAVVFENQRLSYQELDERANQLANYLQRLGVKPETLVGIYVERSLEMMVGLLGILKAGGAYVPLDPNYPQERLQFMLQDSAAPVLLTQQKLIAGLPFHEARLVCLDADWEKIAECNTENIQREVQPDNLAYVIYTSGSTGKPKGVEILHQGLTNYLCWCVQTYCVAQGRGALVHSSIGFDATITALFAPLLVSRTVFLLPVEQEIEALATALLTSDDFSLIKLTPAHLKLLDTLIPTAKLAHKTQIFVIGGEALMKDVVDSWLTHAPKIRLINEYGPTETVVGCCIYEVKPHEHLSDAVPIGRPIANTQLYILDSHLQPVPIGVPGELYIGGAGLARGYLNRPELTQEKFIPNPFDQFSQSKLYKTGDLARYLADGEIDYLGRIDNQVKIRGFRIELGEIEAAIALHPNVQQTVVIAREDNPGDKRLVAYIVPHPEENPEEKVTTEQIRRFLKPQLPEYMIPAALVVLKTFPLTPNGKINHRVLPAPKQVRDEPESTFVAPRDRLELQLTKIWEDVLGIQGIGIHDNFFDLGGQSLLAARLFAEVNEIFQRKLTLSTIFQASTIEQLAKVLSQAECWSNSSYLVPIKSSGSKVPFFCIHGAQGEVLFLKSLANHLSPDQPFYAIRSPGQNGETAPLTCIKEMAKLYIEEIKTIQSQGPYLLGGYSFGGLVAFEMAQQLQKHGQEVSLLALLDCYAPGSLKSLPLGNIVLQHFRDFLAIGPDYVLKKLKTLRTKYLYRLFKGETMKNNYFHHLTSTKYFYNLVNEFPNYTVQDLELWENLYKANLRASSNYIPSVYAGKITIFQVVIDPAEDFYQAVTSCGWSELSNQEVELYNCTGDHYSFLEEPNVQGLAKQLQACLNSANE
ncbi:MAG: hypothetical protein RLZZ04_2742 [Cyanobacteriota bacterium]